MAEKKPKFSEWKAFINVEMTREQKEAFLSWDVHDDEVWAYVAEYLAGGYKLSFGFNPANQTYSCSATGRDSAGPNCGYTVSSFAADIYTATRVTLYKLACVLPPTWADYAPAPTDAFG